MKKKYIIFDFDGTIANTNDIIVASWQATFEHYLGHAMSVRDIEATFGETLVNTIGRLIPDAPVDEVVDFYRAYQDSHKNDSIVYIFPGIKELLEELRARGCIIGVGTSRTAYSFWNYMKMFGMEDSVDEVVTMNDVTAHKPDPETIDAVLRKMTARGEEPQDPEEVRAAAIMIGDTKYDIGCANNAGVDSVIVGWSHYVDEEAMIAEGFVPSYHIDRPDQLLDII